MPVLENAKHEEFARLLACGVKQGEAYLKAGYTENKGAASRLAASPRVIDRIDELRIDVAQKVKMAMTIVSEENWKSLADMGLTMEWVALQYKEIYEKAMSVGSLPAANTAVQSIQKLIEMERNGKGGEERKEEDKISVKDTLALLQGMKEIMTAAAEMPDSGMVDTLMIDVTPEEAE